MSGTTLTGGTYVRDGMFVASDGITIAGGLFVTGSGCTLLGSVNADNLYSVISVATNITGTYNNLQYIACYGGSTFSGANLINPIIASETVTGNSLINNASVTSLTSTGSVLNNVIASNVTVSGNVFTNGVQVTSSGSVLPLSTWNYYERYSHPVTTMGAIITTFTMDLERNGNTVSFSIPNLSVTSSGSDIIKFNAVPARFRPSDVVQNTGIRVINDTTKVAGLIEHSWNGETFIYAGANEQYFNGAGANTGIYRYDGVYKV
jgi:hypothetical protein